MTIRTQMKPRIFSSLGLVALLLFQSLEVSVAATESVPAIHGPYVRVYAPGEDVFPGPDSSHFKTGQSYKEWVPNDHAIIKGRDQCWHAIGITHPKPPDFDPPRYGPAVHEAEWLFFHALSPEGRLKENLQDGSWRDAKKLLTPHERPGESKPCYAPVIVEKDNLFHMIYGPNPMRLATSADLFHWKPCGPLFSDDGSARDPSILFHGGRYILYYVAGNKVLARTSTGLRQWSANAVEVFRMRRGGVPESPAVVKHGGHFYLFYCIYDAHDEVNGAYDNRTFVFRSENPMDFNSAPCIAELKAHASEVFQDEDGDWFISSVEWPHRGLSIAPLVWKQSPEASKGVPALSGPTFGPAPSNMHYFGQWLLRDDDACQCLMFVGICSVVKNGRPANAPPGDPGTYNDAAQSWFADRIWLLRHAGDGTSPSGWSQPELMLNIGGPGESALIGDPCVVEWRGEWHMFYEGTDHPKGWSNQIFHATASAVAGPWRKQGPVRGLHGSLTGSGLSWPTVFVEGDTLWLYYTDGSARLLCARAATQDAHQFETVNSLPVVRNEWVNRGQVFRLPRQYALVYDADQRRRIKLSLAPTPLEFPPGRDIFVADPRQKWRSARVGLPCHLQVGEEHRIYYTGEPNHVGGGGIGMFSPEIDHPEHRREP